MPQMKPVSWMLQFINFIVYYTVLSMFFYFFMYEYYKSKSMEKDEEFLKNWNNELKWF